MCFSAEASFVAAAALSVMGLILIARFYNSKKIALAIIPLLLGIQQLSEGIVWLGIKSPSLPKEYTQTAQYLYLFFAEMFWPVWVPLAFAIEETFFWRRLVMGLLGVLGLGFFFTFGYQFVVYGAAPVQLIEHSIHYRTAPWFFRFLYAAITLGPFFLSSIRKMWILGSANVLAFVVASVFYDYAFISIWCAVAAILSIGLLLILKNDSAR